jgi:hypothetical protein
MILDIFHYHRPPAYRARNRLAGIDYQYHKDRPNFKKKDGTEK